MDAVNQEVPFQQQPVQSKSRNWLKTVSIGLGVIGIGISIAIGGYFLANNKNKPVSQSQTASPAVIQPSPTPDPTANWKTYTNAKYQISFKYPSNYVITEKNDEPYLNIYFFKSLDEKKKFEECNYAYDCFYSEFNILFQKIPNPQQKPIKEFLLNYYSKGVDNNYSPTKIDNISALQQINYLAWGNLYNYYVDKGQVIFRIGASIGSESLNLGAAKILTTFKFTMQ